MKKTCWSILKIAPYSPKEDIISAYEKQLEEMNFNNDMAGIEKVNKAYREAMNADKQAELDEEDEDDEMLIDGEPVEEEKTIIDKVMSGGVLVIIYIVFKVIMGLLD